MATLAVGAIVLSIAIPSYRAVVERQKVSTTVSQLGQIAMAIQKYRAQHVNPPAALTDIQLDTLRDPWGNPYSYLSFSPTAPGKAGKIRKDHNLHPINSEFDLYSKGRDGDSKAPLTAKASRDDVLWARDGAFIGLATDF
jgi:general secretion pathway protein G